MTDTEPSWLTDWLAEPLGTDAALARFDGLPGIGPGHLIGLWQGRTLPTGHPFDSLLEGLGWYGKSIEDSDRVHPLLFRRSSGRIVALNPALMPTAVALHRPGFARSLPVRLAFAALEPVLRARRHGATLGLRDFRGRQGTALIYHEQPITDHLRLAGPDRLVGLMERNGMANPFFFHLARVGPPWNG
ncbi:GXWXG domain-containing protein [Rubellimicrobium rubrum]|nr:GXWXG domain-containing protein [Rubellimicrobium rubrum]